DETHDEVFEAINKFGATAALLVPTQLNYLVKNPQKYHKNYFRTLQDVLTTAAPLSRSTYETIRERFRFRNFRNCYGMSESGCALAVHLGDTNLLINCETVGKVSPGMQVMVIDNNGNQLGANQLGEICMNGDQVTPGYMNNSAENDKLFTRNSFIRSGDIGYYDDNHFFYIIGRSKEVMKVD
ncbi:unnamed protein product, partial [Oppiella nova]